MPARTSDEKGVCPSVCLSVRLSNAWTVTKRKKNQSRFKKKYERSFSLVNLATADVAARYVAQCDFSLLSAGWLSLMQSFSVISETVTLSYTA